MKKIISLVLALAMCFMCVSCGGAASNENKGNGVALDAALESGKIPEIDISIGAKIEDINISEEHDHKDSSIEGYSFVEGDKYSYFLNEQAFAFYKNSKKSAGISVVLSITGAFGLKCNDFVTAEDIKAAFPLVSFTESVVDDKDFKIMPYMLETTKKLTYQLGDRQAVFYVMDDQLIAAAIIDTKNWD